MTTFDEDMQAIRFLLGAILAVVTCLGAACFLALLGIMASIFFRRGSCSRTT